MIEVQSEAGSIEMSCFWREAPTLRIVSLSASDAHSIARPDLTCVIAMNAEGAVKVMSLSWDGGLSGISVGS